jgi:hypothetical protein
MRAANGATTSPLLNANLRRHRPNGPRAAPLRIVSMGMLFCQLQRLVSCLGGGSKRSVQVELEV